MNGGGMNWGMGWIGWVFWLVLLVLLAGVIVRLVVNLNRRGAGEDARPRGETPLQILERRYANGEISTEEYEERRSRLQR